MENKAFNARPEREARAICAYDSFANSMRRIFEISGSSEAALHEIYMTAFNRGWYSSEDYFNNWTKVQDGYPENETLMLKVKNSRGKDIFIEAYFNGAEWVKWPEEKVLDFEKLKMEPTHWMRVPDDRNLPF